MRKILTITIVIFLSSMVFNGILFFSEDVSATTYVSGFIPADTTWKLVNSPYIVVGDVVVDNNTKLSIEPGVVVKFAPGCSLIVNGTLNATGTQSQPIEFTSNQSSPAKGDWNRVRLHGKNNTLDHCEISYGTYPLYIMGWKSNNTISNCHISNNIGDGIYLKETSNNTLDNVTATLSHSNGITVLASEFNIIKNSSFNNNRAFGIYLRSARNNSIENTSVSYNSGRGIRLGLSTNYIEMKNLIVDNNQDIGIDLGGNDHINISNSEVYGNTGTGIDFSGGTEYNKLQNCTVWDNGGSGIDVNKSKYADIVDCNIYENNGEAGIYSSEMVEHLNISDSEIWSNYEDGIEFYGTNYVNITKSYIYDNWWNGISFNGSDIQENNIIQNCTIAGNGYNGIYFYSYSDEFNSIVQNNNISFNTIHHNFQNGIYFYAFSDYYNYNNPIIQNNKIYNNTIYLNTQNGINFEVYSEYYGGYTCNIQYNTIYNNTIYQNDQNGIYFNVYSRRYDSYIIYNNIHNNTIFSNNQNGIYFDVKTRGDDGIIQYNNIINNTIYSNNQNGILFNTSYYNNDYIHIQYNNIYSNTIYLNNQNGIYFHCYAYDNFNFQYNNIHSNLIYSNNKNGIYFDCYCRYYQSYFDYNNIYSNIIFSNHQDGIYIYIYSNNGRLNNPFYECVYFQYNNIYSNTIYSNTRNGISYYCYARNEFLYIKQNKIYSNTITGHTGGSGIFANTDNCMNDNWENSYLYNNTVISNLIGIKFIRIRNHIVYISNISNNQNDGVLLDSSNYNTISYNKIANNNWSGAYLTSSSSNNKIQNNNFTSNNLTGIFINGNSNYNTITRNDILNHPVDGVNITGAKNNYLHHNNFKNNAQNAYDSTIQLNDWDDSAEGNWWDDYTGFDSNNDGIGDIPYDVPGGGSKDWYPIIKPANIVAPHVENTTPPDNAMDISVTPKISITFSMEMNKTFTETAISMSGALTPKNFAWSNAGMTVTFEPSATLSSKTSYAITISIFARDIIGNPMENAYQFSFTTKDIIPPQISLTSPVHGSINIPLNESIVVTFNEPMNITTVSIYCSPEPGGWSVVWSNSDTVATFSHSSFGSQTYYSFRITAGKDLGGNDLISGSVPNPWTFTTMDVIGPEITSTYPSNSTSGVLLSANIVVTFNEKMNISSVTYSCTPDPGGWNVVWSNGDKTATFSHNTFTTQTIYTFQIKAGKDIPGNTLNPSLPNPWSFTTKDTVPPNITATSPVKGAGGVPLNANIIVTFNEEMDDTTVTSICNPNPGGWSVTWSGGNTVASYSHNLFSQNTNYTFQITGGKDLTGNNLVASSVPNPWWFSTQDSTPPQILATTPINSTINITLDANVVVTFSETMNIASVTYSCSPDPGGWIVIWNNGNKKATFLHNSFSSTTCYTFQITGGKDLSGNNLVVSSTPNPWTFTTKDAISPTIISTSPENNSLNVGQSTNIVVTFGEAMDTSTMTYTCSPNPSGWSVVWSAGDTVVTFMHNPYDRFTVYTFKITSAKDLAGNDLSVGSKPNPWIFTTVKNSPPTILSEPSKTAFQDVQYIYDIEAFDPNYDNLTYSISIQPDGMSINSTSGKINWTPTNAQVGINPVVILVSDGNGGIDTQSFNITVQDINDNPQITSTPITIATEDKQYSYQLEVVDIDAGDILVYTLPTAPMGMVVDSSTGLVTWVPSNDQVGINQVLAQVSDGNGGLDSQPFMISVINTNDEPTITSAPVTSATEDERYIYNVEAEDVDIGDTLIFTLTTYPIDMIIESDSGLITWKPTNDQVGLVSISVKVMDENKSAATQAFTILVANANDPPEIVSTPVTSAQEGILYIYNLQATDIDPTNDVLTCSLTTCPDGMEVGEKTGIITWEPNNAQIGQNNVVITVSDGNGGEASQVFELEVKNLNDPPIIISVPITTAIENELYNYDVDAEDMDMYDILTYKLDKYPKGMVIDSETGMITWTPMNEQVGANSVTILVTDYYGSSTKQPYSITVTNTNNAPEITSSPVTSATVDSEYIYDIDGEDIDPTNDDLTFSLTSYPSGMEIEPKTGIITWTPTKDQEGSANVAVQVVDDNDGRNTQTFIISVDTPKPTVTPEKEGTQKKGTQQMTVYSMIGIIILLALILIFLLVFFLREGKSPSRKNNRKE